MKSKLLYVRMLLITRKCVQLLSSTLFHKQTFKLCEVNYMITSVITLQLCSLQSLADSSKHPTHLVLLGLSGHGKGVVGELVVAGLHGPDGQSLGPGPVLSVDGGAEQPGGVRLVLDGQVSGLSAANYRGEGDHLGERGGGRGTAGRLK